MAENPTRCPLHRWSNMIKWVWVNTYRYIFSGMNIHLPAILMFTRGTRFWHTAKWEHKSHKKRSLPLFTSILMVFVRASNMWYPFHSSIHGWKLWHPLKAGSTQQKHLGLTFLFDRFPMVSPCLPVIASFFAGNVTGKNTWGFPPTSSEKTFCQRIIQPWLHSITSETLKHEISAKH